MQNGPFITSDFLGRGLATRGNGDAPERPAYDREPWRVRARPAARARYLQVQTTTDSRAEAMELGHDAVAARLAACAQVAGPIASTYWWENGMERAEEWLLLLKLPADRYQPLAEYLAPNATATTSQRSSRRPS